MTTTIAYMCAQRYQTLTPQKTIDTTIYVPSEKLQISKSGFASKVNIPLSSVQSYEVFKGLLEKGNYDDDEILSSAQMADFKAKIVLPIDIEIVQKIKLLVEQRDHLVAHKKATDYFNLKYEQLKMPDRYLTNELQEKIRETQITLQKTIETSGLFD